MGNLHAHSGHSGYPPLSHSAKDTLGPLGFLDRRGCDLGVKTIWMSGFSELDQ